MNASDVALNIASNSAAPDAKSGVEMGSLTAEVKLSGGVEATPRSYAKHSDVVRRILRAAPSAATTFNAIAETNHFGILGAPCDTLWDHGSSRKDTWGLESAISTILWRFGDLMLRVFWVPWRKNVFVGGSPASHFLTDY